MLIPGFYKSKSIIDFVELNEFKLVKKISSHYHSGHIYINDFLNLKLYVGEDNFTLIDFEDNTLYDYNSRINIVENIKNLSVEFREHKFKQILG